MRYGYGRSVASNGQQEDNNVYRKYDANFIATSGIGFEFVKPMKKDKNANWMLGVFFDNQLYVVGINNEKFSQLPQPASKYKSSVSSARLYAGFEKRLSQKPLKQDRNYITFIGGAGISYNGKKEGAGWSGKHIGDGITDKGEHFQGAYENFITLTGYYMKVSNRSAHPVSPDIFAGFRWNIRNQKGRNALGVELLMNYSLLTKFYLDMPYALDGQPASDRLKVKGTNIQLNAIIPLKNFRKKEKK